MNKYRWLSLILTFAAAWYSSTADAGREQEDFFENKVRPILAEHCWNCHGAKKQEAGLRLDSREALLRGGQEGTVLTPGQPAKSKILLALRHEGDVQMPPEGKLSSESIAAVTTWIEQGAIWPAHADSPVAAISPGDAARSHWAFQPVRKPLIPQATPGSWAKWAASPVDAFILEALRRQQLTPSPATDRATWLRRVYFDLIGLPPTAEQVATFVKDTSPGAFSTVVEQLLANPHYGERWGRHWLDIARYADSSGYVFTQERKFPSAHKYRDWVIQALNNDMPYDKFLTYQIAADHQPNAKEAGMLPAMGFLTVGRRFLNNRHDIIDDRIDVVCRGAMGLTTACARCHDHKYDPISMKDYYGLYGVFNSSEEAFSPEAMALRDAKNPHDIQVFLRGNPARRGEVAPRQFLSVLAGPKPTRFQQGSGRAELARAIVDPRNPLTARVLVNRVWMHHFGAGLVRTTSDFGLRSDPPSHPELLDFLAAWFVENGWSLKKLHRLIVLSNVYQQSSADRAEARARDPENVYYWRMNRRRLDFESLRDAMLLAAGRLDATVGGQAVDLATRPFSTRRTLYGFIDRQNLPSMFRFFDFANPDTHVPQRFVTTVPQQALYLLNGPFLVEQARHLSLLPHIQQVQQPEERVRAIYRQLLGRAPQPEEVELAKKFLNNEPIKEPTTTDATAGTNPLPPAEIAWEYGYGYIDQDKAPVRFTKFPHFSGNSWQSGPNLPDAKLGWVSLHADGGHPGAPGIAAIRRWRAPSKGVIIFRGELKHHEKQGDGVAAKVISSRHGLRETWTAHGQTVNTRGKRLAVQEGDTLDFLVECRANESFDSFTWTVNLGYVDGKGSYSSRTDFRGPVPPAPTPWEHFIQALYWTNEFAFVD